ncbi:nodulation protein NfeD [Parvibaculum sp.]|uniref:nodulation protein NfeD n=1 Tax=Parvibaculum sp. TaxID=2024848 RepID=UPI0034A04874
MTLRPPASPRLRQVIYAVLAVAGAALFGAAGMAQEETPAAAGKPAPRAMVSVIEGAIGPATAKQVADAVATAEEANADVLILKINTPGGLVTSTREIISSILESSVPVAGYVAPAGGHAASAGTYIIYATAVAAMAPGTNIGAATPVTMGGGMPGLPAPEDAAPEKKDGKGGETDGADDTAPARAPQKSNEDAMAAKATNDAVAHIRSLAELHGRNADWAEKAVREGASLSAREAVAEGVVEFMASDIGEFLRQMQGREVATATGKRVLDTEGAAIVEIEPGTMTKLLAILSNPNVAFILMLIGIYGLIFEFSNPGSIGPGVIGAISLLLGLYALNQLPLDYAGLALILLGLALMIAEAFTPTFGVIGLGGVIAFVLGSAMLIDSDQPEFQLSWSVIAGTAAVSVATLAALLGYAWRAQRRPVATGSEELAGMEVQVLDWANGEGHVWAHSERWRARGPHQLAPGTMVKVERLEGLTLILSDAPAVHG